MSEYHNPVLLYESVDALVQKADWRYADATFGGGGHSREILSRLSPQGRLISFDRDADALAGAPEDGRFTLVHNNFRFIHNYVMLYGAQEGFDSLDGILADLGVSSHQFDTADRGFSFRYSAPLDMRMNAQGGKTAADIVNSYTQEELERVLRLYGELDNARRLSGLIVSARDKAPVLTDLAGSALIRRAQVPRESLSGLQDRGQRRDALAGEVPPGRRSVAASRRQAGGHHIPLPRGQDGQELHPQRKDGRGGDQGQFRQEHGPSQGGYCRRSLK